MEPNLKGFSDKNIWRMKQFYETYKGDLKLSTLLREISWSHNLAIFLSLFLRFQIGTSDYSVLKRKIPARSASGIRIAPSRAGGEKSKESSYTEVGALFFVSSFDLKLTLITTFIPQLCWGQFGCRPEGLVDVPQNEISISS